jgi:DNA modification methylase
MTPVGFLETNVIYCDDNLHRLAQFPAECIDLIYLDPPFFSNRNYEVIWGDEAEIRSFEDRWQGGIHVYVAWMRERMIEVRRVLKPTGSVYLHCDWHASHYLKVMMDEVFDRANFLNNIVWLYGLGGSSDRYWPRKHDDILWYSKTRDGHYFEATRVPATSVRMAGQDKKAPDYWAIPTINNMARERLGYPTQKPEALLHQIVESSSRKGDIVLDPFAGCGTALVAAHQLGRQWIGIDISPTAVGLMKWRMQKVGATEIKLIGMPVSEAQLHALKPFEFQNWVIQRMNGTHSPRKSGDMGIDGFSFMLHEPIQVKQSSSIGRNVVDNFETAVKRSGKDKGYIVAFSYGKGAYEEVARAKGADGLTIELLTVADLLEGKADLVTPDVGLFGADMPRPAARDAESRPSVEELVASDAGRTLARAATDPESYGSD